MARKGMFTETKKALKSIIKGRYFVQFADNAVYISEGTIIMKMPIAYYTEYILREIPGLPAYADEDKNYTGDNGKLTIPVSGFNLKSYIEQMDAPYDVTAPHMLFDNDKCDLVRAFTWFDGTETTGAIVNEAYYKISKEYSNGTYHCGKKNSPIYTSTSYDNDFLFLMLPIHYTYGSPFMDYIDALNRANDVLSVKSNIAA